MIAGSLEIQMLANLARLQTDMNQAKGMVGSAMKNVESAVATAKSALASLGIGLSAAYFANLIKGSIDALDHLNDLNKTTDIAVDKLAGFRLLAKQTGGDLDSLAASVNKLSQNIGKDPEKFKALGVSAKDPLEAFKQLSDVYKSLQDPQQRSAVAAEALGKAWSGAAPALSEGSQRIGEIVQRGALLAGVTQEMVTQADELNDKWAELGGTGGMLTRLVAPVLPMLIALTDEMLEAQKKSNALDGEFKPLLETFRALVIFGGNVAFVFRGIGNEVGGLTAQIVLLASAQMKVAKFDLKGAAEDARAALGIGQMMRDDAEKARREFDNWESRMMQVGKQSADVIAQNRRELARSGVSPATDPRGAAAAAARAAAFLKENKEAADADSTYRNLLKTLKEKLLVDQQQLEVNRLQLTLDALAPKQRATITAEREKELVAIAKKVDAQNAEKKAVEAFMGTLAAQKEFLLENAKGIAEVKSQRDAAVTATEKAIEQIEFETKALTMTNEQREIAIALRELETSGLDKTSAAYEQLGIRIKVALANKQAVQAAIDQQKEVLTEMGEFAKEAARNIQRSLSDGLFDIMQGKFDNMGDRFKAMLDRMAADALAKNLASKLFGDMDKTGNIGGWVGKGLEALGIGGTQKPAPVVDAVLSSAGAATEAATAATFTAAVTASGTAFAAEVSAAGIAFVPEITTAGAAFGLELTTSGAAFATEVAAAGAAFAATVAAGSAGSSAISAAGGIAGMFAMAAANGAAFNPGGVVPFAQGGIVGRPTLFAFGQGGQVGLMGERGSEAVMPLRRGPDGRLGVESHGGRNVTVNMPLYFSGKQDRQSIAQGMAEGGQRVQRILARDT